jgi:hypothetical protein
MCNIVSVGSDRGRTAAQYDGDRDVLSPEVDEAAEP